MREEKPEPTPFMNYSASVLFDRLWNAHMENQLSIERQMEEVERRFNQQQEEKKRQINEIWNRLLREEEEKSRQIKLYDSKFTRQIMENGLYRERYEAEISYKLCGCFNELGYSFDDITPSGHKILDEKGNIKAEIDIVLESINCIMAVLVTVKPGKADIEHCIKQLLILKEHRGKYNDRRKIFGAIMMKKNEPSVRKAILDAGLFIIEQDKNRVKIIPPKKTGV